jgi:hypothetical protein
MYTIAQYIFIFALVIVSLSGILLALATMRFCLGPPPVQAFDPFPEPIRKPMSTRVRLAQDHGLGEKRAKWRDRMEIDRICQDIAEGRRP